MARTDDINARVLDARLTSYETELTRQYRTALRNTRQTIGTLYEKYATNGKLTYAEMSKYNRLSALEKQIREDILPPLSKNQAVLNKMPPIEYEEAFYRYGWSIDQQLGTSLRWGQLNENTVKAAVLNPLDKIAQTRLRATSIARIRTSVTQGLIQGASYPNMMKGIRAAINGSAKDAIRIARTEGQRAQVMGQQANYDHARDIGVDMVEVWDATLDSRTREDHGAIDGQEAHYIEGTPFWNTSVGQVAGPLQSGYASFDINCRCRIRGQVAGTEPGVRRVDGKVVPYQTYDQWKKGLNAQGKNTAKAVPAQSPRNFYAKDQGTKDMMGDISKTYGIDTPTLEYTDDMNQIAYYLGGGANKVVINRQAPRAGSRKASMMRAFQNKDPGKEIVAWKPTRLSDAQMERGFALHEMGHAVDVSRGQRQRFFVDSGLWDKNKDAYSITNRAKAGIEESIAENFAAYHGGYADIVHQDMKDYFVSLEVKG